MKRLVLHDPSEQLVANALHAYATMLEGQIKRGQERQQRSREYERLLRLLRGDGSDDGATHGIQARLCAPKPVKPMWEPIPETPPGGTDGAMPVHIPATWHG